MQIQQIKIKLLHPHPINRPPNPHQVAWLVERMKEDGFDLAHPIPVRKNGDGYHMAGGNQRRLAATKIGLKEVPCIVKPPNERQLIFEIMRDNAQEPVHAIDVGNQFNYMHREMGMTVRTFAKTFRLTRTRVKQYSDAVTVYGRLKDKVNEDLRPVWKQLAVIYGSGLNGMARSGRMCGWWSQS